MIECNPDINFGMPALKGRRLTVYNIVTKIYYEQDVSVALKDYSISIQDAKDAVNYCRHLICKEDKGLIQFCDGCILRTIAEGWKFDNEKYSEVNINGQTIVISWDNKTYFIGTLKEFENSEFGKVTWGIAEEVHNWLDNNVSK